VFRPSLKRERLCGLSDNLIALVSDEPLTAEVPCFYVNDIAGLVDWLEKTGFVALR
jgi:hypothetical protein